NNDWINRRNESFKKLIPLAPDKKDNVHSKSIFIDNVIGTVTSRDAWLYNFSNNKLKNNVNIMIDYYNSERERLLNKNGEVKVDTSKISWSRGLKNKLKNNENIEYDDNKRIRTIYRPFVKENMYFDKNV